MLESPSSPPATVVQRHHADAAPFIGELQPPIDHHGGRMAADRLFQFIFCEAELHNMDAVHALSSRIEGRPFALNVLFGIAQHARCNFWRRPRAPRRAPLRRSRGLETSGTTTPITPVRRVTRPRAMSLGR
jgi:hypothetical protein